MTKNMDTTAGLITLCVLLGTISHIDGACTYPTNLQGGSFFTTDGDTLNFTSSTMASLAIHTFGSYSFNCDLNSGSQYISKSEVFYRFSLPFEAFICMELTEVSSNQYTFYQPTTELSDAGNMRVKIFLEGKTISTVSEVCDVTDYTNLTNALMIKDGSIDSEKVACPTAMQGYFSYSYDAGSGNVCTGSSELDTCTDTTLMTFNLTACTQMQAYSAEGQLNCLSYSTSGDYTSLIVYNRDTTVDQSTTYRLSCYMISSNSTTVYATQYPNNCYSGQTSTSVNSPGATVEFTQTTTCPVTTTTTEAPTTTSAASTGIIVGIIILLLAIILIVLFAIWFWWKKKKEEEARRKKELEDLEDGLSDGLPDESKYDIDRLMYTPDQLLTPSHVHPKVTGKILDRDNFEGFGDDEYIDEFGWQDMIDANDFMNMRKRRDGKDEFEVGDAQDKSMKKKVKDLLKSKKKKKKKGKKKKKKKGKTKQYETDDEYEDIEDDDEGDGTNRRELTIYLNGGQDEEEDDDSPSDSRRKARFEETDDEKAKRKKKRKKDIDDVETVSDIISYDMMIGDLDTEKSLENEAPRLILPNLRDSGVEDTEKKKRKRTKAKRTEQPMSFKSFRKRKVTAWLDKTNPAIEGDPLPMFYEDPKLKALPPLQRANRKKQPTLWTDILKKFGGDFKEFEFHNKRNMSENRWRKLLEELYTDKKYFDYVSKSSRGKNVEDDLKEQAKDGLDYLYDRATFWEEQKPIPPRPVSYGPPVVPRLNLNSAKSPRGKKKKGMKRAPPTPMTQVRLDSMDEFQKPPRETTF